MKKMTNLTRMTMVAAALASLSTVSATALAAPETFVIDGSHTYPRFSYSHFGYSKQLRRRSG